MSKLKTIARKIISIPLPALCYGATLLVWLIVCTAGLVADSMARANGALQEQPLTVKDFRLVEIGEMPDGAIYSATDDPQMILDTIEGKVRSFRFAADFSGEGYEMSLYYTTSETADFDKDMRVWPVVQDDGSYLFELPREDIKRLRLDPVSVPGIVMDFHEIVLNEPVSLFSYYNPGWAGLVMLLLLPAFGAACLRWLADMLQHYGPLIKERQGSKKEGVT